MKVQLSMLEEVAPLPDISSYDWIVVSSSAGKDSMATLDVVCVMAAVAGVMERVVVVHADLGRIEWKGSRELAERQAKRWGVRFIAVSKKTNSATKDDLLDRVEQRRMWPDARRRWCTSDFKRGPIRKVFTRLTDIFRAPFHGLAKPRQCRILSCMGMRADESPARAKKQPFGIDAGASNGRRHVDLWLPLHRWSVKDVWGRIHEAGMDDLIHPAYGLGMPRLSCCFCIFAPKDALVVAGHHNPELLAEYVRVEETIGHKFRMNTSMAEVAAAVAGGEKPASVAGWRM